MENHSPKSVVWNIDKGSHAVSMFTESDMTLHISFCSKSYYIIRFDFCRIKRQSVAIIECDSTLYVGMTREQNGSSIPSIHYSFAKYRLWTSIKSKPAFRSPSKLIIEIIKLLAIGKNLCS